MSTQAEITRCVKAAIKGAHDMGYRVAGYEVSFNQGVPTVRVTTGAESAPPAPVQHGGGNVEDLKKRMRGCHAERP